MQKSRIESLVDYVTNFPRLLSMVAFSLGQLTS